MMYLLLETNQVAYIKEDGIENVSSYVSCGKYEVDNRFDSVTFFIRSDIYVLMLESMYSFHFIKWNTYVDS